MMNNISLTLYKSWQCKNWKLKGNVVTMKKNVQLKIDQYNSVEICIVYSLQNWTFFFLILMHEKLALHLEMSD